MVALVPQIGSTSITLILFTPSRSSLLPLLSSTRKLKIISSNSNFKLRDISLWFLVRAQHIVFTHYQWPLSFISLYIISNDYSGTSFIQRDPDQGVASVEQNASYSSRIKTPVNRAPDKRASTVLHCETQKSA